MTQNNPPIDLLTDDSLYYIMRKFVGDADLGSCLLAWRRFHVFSMGDMQQRKYRCATVMSVCAAGDADGLRFVLDNADVYMPPGRFRWDSCLFAAAITGSVAVMDTIKRTVRAKGSWPVHPILWWSLAFGAAHNRHDAALAWLCLPDNATTLWPTLSADEKKRFASAPTRLDRVDVDGDGRMVSFFGITGPDDLALLVPFDPSVVSEVKRIAEGLAPNAYDALCDRISRASGLDARVALGGSIFCTSRGMECWTLVGAEEPHDGVEESSGDVDQWLRQGDPADGTAVRAALFGGHHADAVRIYQMLRESNGRADVPALHMLATALAQANRADLLDELARDMRDSSADPSAATRESDFWTCVVKGAAEGGHISILELAHNRPINRNQGCCVHAALENRNLDAAAWLCARGHACGCGPYRIKSLLYVALRERRFDVARILLDPAATDTKSHEEVGGCSAYVIHEAARDAVDAGDLKTATRLHARYRHIVDEVVARLRSYPWPMRSYVPSVDTARTLFKVLREHM